jgi:hypothetical protein
MIEYRYNRSASARNPQLPDSVNQRIAARAAAEEFPRHPQRIADSHQWSNSRTLSPIPAVPRRKNIRQTRDCDAV